MISYIKGELVNILADSIIVENNGIGYGMNVPKTVTNQMPQAGTEIKIYTYLYIREDNMSLYGFLTKDDLEVFKLLITVSGIGPKGALGILSTITADELRFAILTGDAKAISKAPGIGKKTAEKLIIELKDKLKIKDISVLESDTEDFLDSETNSRNEVIMALVALGYSQQEALRAIKASAITEAMDSSQILKLALRKI